MDEKKKKIIYGVAAAAILLLLIIAMVVAGKNKKPEEKTGGGEATVTPSEAVAEITKGEEQAVTATPTPVPTESASEEPEYTPTAEPTKEPEDGVIKYTATNHTAVGTEKGDGYEGTEGSGDYNYGEALQKSLLFYELQRSGPLPEVVRCNWRGDSALSDGSDVSLDLTGGWYDAGDHVKFNLPMSYTAAMLGWSILEDYDAYEESKQLEYALGNVKWANDYFIKCHPEDEVYYYQIGSGSQDHTWWGPAEAIELKMSRPSYKVDKDNPGSTVTAGTAASLAICSILYKDIDKDYSADCLDHAKSLYDFAAEYKSDTGYTAANGFYDSWSGFYDELAWAGAWLYKATGEKDYLDDAKTYYSSANQDYDWAMCWDDVHIGAALVLSELTDDKTYTDAVEKHLDYWTDGTSDGERIAYTPKGLAWLDSWGSLRYATTTGYLAVVYSRSDKCSDDKAKTYWDFAVAQAGYALGDTGRSFLIGFGEDYPKHPHHRTSQGSYADNMNEPGEARHTLYGALVGGPDSSDGYTDTVSNYTTNEVACDYNAGFTGLLAALYSKYHGQTIKNFGAVESVNSAEYYSEAAINASGDDFIEIKAMVYNMTGWPARTEKDIELRYFVDLSEIYEAGGSAEDIVVSENYMKDAYADGLKTWDEENNIYYLSIKVDGSLFYPGGQDQYKKEVQVRMKSGIGVWDDSNDPSFEGLVSGTLSAGTKLALYEKGVLVYGSEPAAGDNPGVSITPNTNSQSGGSTAGGGTSGSTGQAGLAGGTASSGDIALKVDYSNASSTANSISANMTITNNGKANIPLNELLISYYFTKDGKSSLNFACYYSGMQGGAGSYYEVSGAKGEFKDAKGEDADTVCEISFSDSLFLEPGGSLSVNMCINASDWSDMTLSNDYSGKDVSNIVISQDGKIIFGEKP